MSINKTIRSKWQEGLIFSFVIIIVLFISISNNAVDLVDSFSFFGRAYALSFTSMDMWVNGYYPFGYPLLLKLISFFTNDYLMSAKIVSTISSFFAVYFVFRISGKLFDRTGVLISIILFAFNQTFLKYATTDNTDMVAFSFLIGAVYFLIKFNDDERYKWVIVSGILLAFSYLMRFTALTILPAIIFWVTLQFNISLNQRKAYVYAYLITFTLVALPLFALNFIKEGNPFWNTQYHNVWFGLYGGNNWGKNWMMAEATKSLTEVIGIDPLRFFKHICSNLLMSITNNIFNLPAYPLLFIGGIVALFDKGKRNIYLLFLVTSLVYLLAISMVFINPRVVIYILPFQVLLIVNGVRFLFDLGKTSLDVHFKFLYRLLPVFMLVFCFFSYAYPMLKCPISNTGRNNLEISDRLKELKVKDKRRVMSLSFNLYDNTSIIKEYFQRPWYSPTFHSINSPLELKHYMINHKFDYLVFDYSAIDNVKGLNLFWWQMLENTPTYFQYLFKNGYGGGIIRLNPMVYETSRVSTYDDWNAFLDTDPIKLIDTTYYARVRYPYFHLVHQKDGPWETMDWYKQNLYPAWLKYKEDHVLY